ncbi:MAG: glycosyltransferase [Oscillospiraceae bacterium]|nr:glycosyltransferase [Oscillospiraceae bacterium]
MSYTSADHTFVVCAYKESSYLDECLRSLEAQTVKSNIIISTSTPSEYIDRIAEQHGVSVYVNGGDKGLGLDWNFGYSCAKTPIITLAHQDDVYEKEYCKKALLYINKSKHPLIFFTDYSEIRNGNIVHDNKLLKIKRFLLMPMRVRAFQKSRWIRRRVLSMGCPICCPSVTFFAPNLPKVIFDKKYLSNADWQAWEKFSKLKGDFLYCFSKPLMYHRVHEESTTSDIIGNNQRTQEDFAMYCKFWPRFIAKMLIKPYSKSQESNKL